MTGSTELTWRPIAVVRQTWSLGWEEKTQAARIAALVVIVRLALRLLAMPTLLAWATSPLGKNRQHRVGLNETVRLVDSVLALRFTVWRPNCLTRSLVLARMLRRSGHPVRVVIGVENGGQGLQGHSWLELNGRPFAEDGDPNDQFREILVSPART
jgi:hypothetical protein